MRHAGCVDTNEEIGFRARTVLWSSGAVTSVQQIMHGMAVLATAVAAMGMAVKSTPMGAVESHPLHPHPRIATDAYQANVHHYYPDCWEQNGQSVYRVYVQSINLQRLSNPGGVAQPQCRSLDEMRVFILSIRRCIVSTCVCMCAQTPALV